MTECGECGVDLDPAWKFCIFCGTRVDVRKPETPAEGVVSAEPISAAPTAPAPRPAELPIEIPSAFRPLQSGADGDELDYPDRPKFDLPLVLGIAIGVFGLVAVITAFAIIVSGG